MSPSARTIVELNIRHFREILETEKDPVKRETILRLLQEQEGKLADLAKKEPG
jgi:hypothetical protein